MKLLLRFPKLYQPSTFSIAQILQCQSLSEPGVATFNRNPSCYELRGPNSPWLLGLYWSKSFFKCLKKSISHFARLLVICLVLYFTLFYNYEPLYHWFESCSNKPIHWYSKANAHERDNYNYCYIVQRSTRTFVQN